jgi:hypothetical protein
MQYLNKKLSPVDFFFVAFRDQFLNEKGSFPRNLKIFEMGVHGHPPPPEGVQYTRRTDKSPHHLHNL